MSQQEILTVLEKSKVPLTAREISEKLGKLEVHVCADLRSLLKFNEVKVMELNKELSMKFYKCKRRLRLFHV